MTKPKKPVKKTEQEKAHIEISHCHIEMNMQADGATQILAEALLSQAKANEANSEAMRKLAEALKPIEVCGIKVVDSELKNSW